MNKQTEPPEEAEKEFKNKPAAKNDGPDETPVHADVYHDEGRRNVLEEGTEEPGGEKGDDL